MSLFCKTVFNPAFTPTINLQLPQGVLRSALSGVAVILLFGLQASHAQLGASSEQIYDLYPAAFQRRPDRVRYSVPRLNFQYSAANQLEYATIDGSRLDAHAVIEFLTVVGRDAQSSKRAMWKIAPVQAAYPPVGWGHTETIRHSMTIGQRRTLFFDESGRNVGSTPWSDVGIPLNSFSVSHHARGFVPRILMRQDGGAYAVVDLRISHSSGSITPPRLSLEASVMTPQRFFKKEFPTVGRTIADSNYPSSSVSSEYERLLLKIVTPGVWPVVRQVRRGVLLMASLKHADVPFEDIERETQQLPIDDLAKSLIARIASTRGIERQRRLDLLKNTNSARAVVPLVNLRRQGRDPEARRKCSDVLSAFASSSQFATPQPPEDASPTHWRRWGTALKKHLSGK